MEPAGIYTFVNSSLLCGGLLNWFIYIYIYIKVYFLSGLFDLASTGRLDFKILHAFLLLPIITFAEEICRETSRNKKVSGWQILR